MSGRDASVLNFTGERFTPECVREISYEHWHRYAFARRFAAGKRVLDAACGEGYGASLLATVAASVVGVDVDATTIDHARERYGTSGNVEFRRADATDLPFEAQSFDVVISFETLEHLARQEDLIAGFARVLGAKGLLVISTPDKHAYSDLTGFRNEHHVRELYREEFVALLERHFGHVRLYGQKLAFRSALWPLDAGAGNDCETLIAGPDGAVAAEPLTSPMYFVALCSDATPLPDAPALSLYGDRDESVYAHYTAEIRKNMQAGARIAELEAELCTLRSQQDSAQNAQTRALGRRRWWPWRRR
jgi:SAM-dependent methyltransferase